MNRSEWVVPRFIKPKNNGTVQLLSNLREINQRICRKPFPIPKIQDMLLNLEVFTYASSLDSNMGYYHIELSPLAKQIYTIVLPWGKYEYQKLSMGSVRVLISSKNIYPDYLMVSTWYVLTLMTYLS